MDIFEKCYAPSLAGELKEKGVYPYFHALQSRQDVEVMMEGKRPTEAISSQEDQLRSVRPAK